MKRFYQTWTIIMLQSTILMHFDPGILGWLSLACSGAALLFAVWPALRSRK